MVSISQVNVEFDLLAGLPCDLEKKWVVAAHQWCRDI